MIWVKSSVGRFVAELRRRKVIPTLFVYVVFAFVVFQVADATFEPLNVSPRVHTALVIALVAAVPFVAVLAWFFDVTAQGIVRTAPAEKLAKFDEFGEALAQRPRLWIDATLFVVAAGIIAFLLIRPGEPPPATRVPSIAVMPFEDLSAQGDQRYFCDGIVDVLIDALVRIPGLQVTGRYSAFRSDDGTDDYRAIGSRLGVANVLEGSVLKDGNRVKIITRLVDVATGLTLWSETYDHDRTVRDLIAVQEDIARSVTGALRVRLLPETVERFATPITLDDEAYELYLKGRGALRSSWTQSNIEQAIEYFNDALRIDPRFAYADVGLCQAHREMYRYTKKPVYFDLAMDACNTARARLIDVPDLHVALGLLYYDSGRYALSEDEFQKALALDAMHVDALWGLSRIHRRAGDFESAKAAVRKAIDAAPEYSRLYMWLAWLLIDSGSHSEGIEVLRNAVARDPRDPNLYNDLGAAYGWIGDFERSAEAFAISVKLEPEPIAYENLGNTYFYLERFNDAYQMFKNASELLPSQYVYHMRLGDACRYIGEPAQCASHYREAIELANEYRGVAQAEAHVAADLAVMYARVGDLESAGQLARQATTNGPNDYHGPWAHTLIAVMNGRHEEALGHLAEAHGNGYPASVISVHPDLAPLREYARFAAIVRGERGDI